VGADSIRCGSVASVPCTALGAVSSGGRRAAQLSRPLGGTWDLSGGAIGRSHHPACAQPCGSRHPHRGASIEVLYRTIIPFNRNSTLTTQPAPLAPSEASAPAPPFAKEAIQVEMREVAEPCPDPVSPPPPLLQAKEATLVEMREVTRAMLSELAQLAAAHPEVSRPAAAAAAAAAPLHPALLLLPWLQSWLKGCCRCARGDSTEPVPCPPPQVHVAGMAAAAGVRLPPASATQPPPRTPPSSGGSLRSSVGSMGTGVVGGGGSRPVSARSMGLGAGGSRPASSQGMAVR